MKLYKYVKKTLLKLSHEYLPLLFWILLLFGFDKPYIAILTLLCAGIHESGHIAAIVLLKCDTGLPFGHFSGLRIRQNSESSYIKSIIIYALGPGTNFLAALLLFPWIFSNHYIFVFALLNFATAFSNLLPVRSYDGYSILSEIFKMRAMDRALRLLDFLSFTICALFALASLYMMYYRNEGYWMYGLFMVTVLSEISKALKTSVWEN